MKRPPLARRATDRASRARLRTRPGRLPVLRILFAIAFTLAVVALLPPMRSRVEPAFHSGEVADRDVVGRPTDPPYPTHPTNLTHPRGRTAG